MDLSERHGGSTGFSEFVEPSYAKIKEYINDNAIVINSLSDTGYTNDGIEIINRKNLESKAYRKTELVLEVAKIINELKQKYEAELRKRVTEHVKHLLK